MTQAGKCDNLWSIILAGGDGERLRPLIQRWQGRHKPKQYCTFIGTRSMFQHTLDRADRITAPERKVTVVAQSHHGEVRTQLVDRHPGKIILQPANRDTAAGIFLALTYVRAQDPAATVVLFPSDHFIYPEDRFVEIVQSAVQAAKQLKPWLFLLGVCPDRLDLEYGWIRQGSHLGWINGQRVRAVEAFLEKPGCELCRAAMASGALWNTLVMASRVETLWEMGWRCFPDMMPLLKVYGQAIGSSEEEAVLKAVYEVMPVRNFSTDLLQCVPKQVAVIELSGVLWCDWGKPERIVDTLRRIGKSPAFPLGFAASG